MVDRWEQEPYLVIHIPNSDIPVYKVKRETGKGPSRMLHRNMLLAFNHVPSISDTCINEYSHSSSQLPSQRKKKKSAQPPTQLESSDDSSSSSGSESDTAVKYIIPQRRVRISELPPVDHMDHTPELSSIPSYTQTPDPSSYSSHQSTHVEQSPSTSASHSVSDHSMPAVPQESVVQSPPPLIRRSERERKAPDRYGQWSYSPIVIYYLETLV